MIDKSMTGGDSGAGRESACKNAESLSGGSNGDARSLGTLITFGKLKILDLGDLTRDKEMQLMCSVNNWQGRHLHCFASRVGPEQQPRFGLGIDSRVAIMITARRKAGPRRHGTIIRKIPAPGRLWQLHFSEMVGLPTTLLRSSSPIPRWAGRRPLSATNRQPDGQIRCVQFQNE